MKEESKNLLLTIEYDGTGFSGWQRQPGQRTVQGELERVLSVLCAAPITIDGASRTDAGVHAYGQRATLRGNFRIPAERIPFAANNLLAGEGRYSVPDVRIKDIQEMPEDFHARFSCVGKKYIYLIRNQAMPDIMRRNHCYQIPAPLDLSAMQKAAELLAGERDYRAFMSAGGNGSGEGQSTVREIYSAKIDRAEGDNAGMLRFEIEGSGFLYNMVRIIVGTLVEVGQGKIRPEAITDIVASLDRTRAGHTAPPQGLYLAEVYYSKK